MIWNTDSIVMLVLWMIYVHCRLSSFTWSIFTPNCDNQAQETRTPTLKPGNAGSKAGLVTIAHFNRQLFTPAHIIFLLSMCVTSEVTCYLLGIIHRLIEGFRLEYESLLVSIEWVKFRSLFKLETCYHSCLCVWLEWTFCHSCGCITPFQMQK